MNVYEINDQCNRYEDLTCAQLQQLVEIFQVNYPNFNVKVHTSGIFRVWKPTLLGSFVLVPRIFKFDVSIIYNAFVDDSEISFDLKEQCLRHLLDVIGPPDIK